MAGWFMDRKLEGTLHMRRTKEIKTTLHNMCV